MGYAAGACDGIKITKETRELCAHDRGRQAKRSDAASLGSNRRRLGGYVEANFGGPSTSDSAQSHRISPPWFHSLALLKSTGPPALVPLLSAGFAELAAPVAEDGFL